MKKILTLIISIACTTSFGVQANETISASEIARRFLIKDIYINSYIVAEKDLYDIYDNEKSLVLKYFPDILNNYDLTLYAQFSLGMLLYLEGEEFYLKKQWNEYKKYSTDEDFQYIIKLLKRNGIEPVNLDESP